jgi:DNA-binding HxlR family transcriptional regulator
LSSDTGEPSSEDGSGSGGFDSSRAELFDELGHPTRIRILQALSEQAMTFSELKKEVGIESSGHLIFHLGKLNLLFLANANGAE